MILRAWYKTKCNSPISDVWHCVHVISAYQENTTCIQQSTRKMCSQDHTVRQVRLRAAVEKRRSLVLSTVICNGLWIGRSKKITEMHTHTHTHTSQFSRSHDKNRISIRRNRNCQRQSSWRGCRWSNWPWVGDRLFCLREQGWPGRGIFINCSLIRIDYLIIHIIILKIGICFIFVLLAQILSWFYIYPLFLPLPLSVHG